MPVYEAVLKACNLRMSQPKCFTCNRAALCGGSCDGAPHSEWVQAVSGSQFPGSSGDAGITRLTLILAPHVHTCKHTMGVGSVSAPGGFLSCFCTLKVLKHTRALVWYACHDSPPHQISSQHLTTKSMLRPNTIDLISSSLTWPRPVAGQVATEAGARMAALIVYQWFCLCMCRAALSSVLACTLCWLVFGSYNWHPSCLVWLLLHTHWCMCLTAYALCCVFLL